MTAPAHHSVEFTRMAEEWERLTAEPDVLPEWQSALRRLADEQDRLRAHGLWRTGRKTLLGALGVHHDEVIMCRGLAWLLTPDAWHGLGSALLDGLLARLGVDPTGSGTASVVVEEPRDDTRADIVVRFATTTILIEAKVWALEQPTQCDRLAHHWRDESPTLVYLTRDGIDPTTAIDSRGEWHPLGWSDIADMLEQAIAERREATVGAAEYLETLKHYGGTRR